MAEAVFEKHVYGKEKKRTLKPLEDFVRCPLEFRGMVHTPIPALLEKIRGEHLCISVLFDEHFHYWDGANSVAEPAVPDEATLRKTVEAFKDSLFISDDAIHMQDRV